MNVASLRDLYDYNAWSNRLTCDSLEAISNEQFVAPMEGSFASIRDTLLHILGAEWIWWQRCIGNQPRGLLSAAEYPDVASFRAKWQEVDAGFAEFLATLKDERLTETITYINRHNQQWTYRIGTILFNNVNHSSYHRGQVVTLLRQIGATPKATDYLLYIDATK